MKPYEKKKTNNNVYKQGCNEYNAVNTDYSNITTGQRMLKHLVPLVTDKKEATFVNTPGIREGINLALKMCKH